MNIEWPIVRLGDYCTKIGSGATPKGGSEVYLESGSVRLIRSQNIYNDAFYEQGLVFINEDAAEKLKNVAVQSNDVLLNITGDSVARVCLAPDHIIPARVNQHVSIIRPQANELDARFLRYYLASPKVQDYLLAIAAAGATRNALTKNQIENLQIPKPDVKIQSWMADVLSTLDDKIALNRQINQTLEAMAQALFRSWFVDFEPVRAKVAALETGEDPTRAAMRTISGKTDAELDALQTTDADAYAQLEVTARLFPDALVESELGLVPEGWEVARIDKILELAYGKALKSTDRTDGEVPVYGSGGLTGYHDQSIVKGPGIIVGRKGTVGSIYYEDSNFFPIDTVFYVTPKPGISLLFCYHVLAGLHLKNMNTDAAVPGLNRNNVYRLLALLPDSKILRTFTSLLKEWMSLEVTLKNENRTLATLRDTLLPKLLSGELAVNDVGAGFTPAHATPAHDIPAHVTPAHDIPNTHATPAYDVHTPIPVDNTHNALAE